MDMYFNYLLLIIFLQLVGVAHSSVIGVCNIAARSAIIPYIPRNVECDAICKTKKSAACMIVGDKVHDSCKGWCNSDRSKFTKQLEEDGKSCLNLIAMTMKLFYEDNNFGFVHYYSSSPIGKDWKECWCNDLTAC